MRVCTHSVLQGYENLKLFKKLFNEVWFSYHLLGALV